MKLMVPALLAIFLAFAHAETFSDCKCWDGYQARKSEDGLKCYGLLLSHIQDCNIPRPPRCKCSGKVTGILMDKTGTWCSEYSKGVEQKRWHCENNDEWDEFFKRYPERKRDN